MHTLKQHHFVWVLCVFVLSLVPGLGFSLTFGSIKLHSYLNEPLNAEIELQGAEEIDRSHLTASLASVEDFKHIELARPYFLSALRFEVVEKNKQLVLKITSDEVVKQPYLEFLVLLTWPEGRVVRDYTLLLDPVPFDAASKHALNEEETFEDFAAIAALQTKNAQKEEEINPPTEIAHTNNMLGVSDSTLRIVADQQKQAASLVPAAPVVPVEALSAEPKLTLSYKQILLASGLVLLVAAALTIWFFRRTRIKAEESFENNLNMLNIMEDTLAFDEEIKLKLDLAKQYIAYEDTENAKAILEEVIEHGNNAEIKLAKKILQKIHH